MILAGVGDIYVSADFYDLSSRDPGSLATRPHHRERPGSETGTDNSHRYCLDDHHQDKKSRHPFIALLSESIVEKNAHETSNYSRAAGREYGMITSIRFGPGGER
jgi:hypothetical protein